MYDNGIIHSFRFDIPIISIGNVTVGGTGKTPHIEMFIREYIKTKRVAVISRGYGRKGRGSHTVSIYDKASQVGDEPLQIKRKFPTVTVVVDSNRKRAIEQLCSLSVEEKPEIILLDDAMQYRKVIPSRLITLISYDRPVFKDSLLPIGRLRDLPEQIKRADTIVISKCPPYLNEWEIQKKRDINRIGNRHKLYYTTIIYKEPRPVFQEEGNNRFIYSKEVILFTGIANDSHLRRYVKAHYTSVFHISFGDHHKFSRSNVRSIYSLSKRHPRALVLTTEKDAQRIIFDTYIPDTLKTRLFYIPIEVKMAENQSIDGLFTLN